MTPTLDLSGKTIVVTGGAGLLGAMFCRKIAAAGGQAVVADYNLEAARKTAAQINAEHPAMALPHALDITDTGSVTQAIAELHDTQGAIHGLINNAYPRNAAYGAKLEDVTYADFCENMGLHAGGYFLTSQKFAAYFATHGGGSIVNMSSIYGVIAPKFSVYDGTSMTMPVEYAAIKAAVVHLTRYFAQYYKKQGVRVNAISPGGIEDSQPQAFLEAYATHCGLRGMLDKDDIAGALLFLLSDASRFMTGQNLVVDDGFTL
jgi:NAD(P)-dependent dehydrogenase (short-subunit alcohol dehydrogenase family)